jgi:hypothetical protein
MPNNICPSTLNCIFYCAYNKNSKIVINAFKIEQGTTLIDNIPELTYADSICSDDRDMLLTSLVNDNISLNGIEIPN